MAYHNSNFPDSDVGEYYPTPYNSSYDVVPFQDSITYSDFELNQPKFIDYYGNSSEIMYSSYDFSEPKLLEYYPITNYGSCDPYRANNYEINYSRYSFSEPKVIEYYYDPTPNKTQYYISYSTIEQSRDELDYEEYDPTPYGGGYDQTLTYGKPLPPSDEICYPRSTPVSNALPLDGFSYNSIPSSYGDDDIRDSSDKPVKDSKPTETTADKESNGNNEGAIVEPIVDKGEEKQSNGDEGSALVECLDANYGKEIEGCNNGHDYPWLGYEYGYGNGRIGGFDYEYGTQIVPKTQYGYDSEGMEYCESIFGYWPCLAKKNKKRNEVIQEDGDKGSNYDPWKGPAEYIFGSPFGYE